MDAPPYTSGPPEAGRNPALPPTTDAANGAAVRQTADAHEGAKLSAIGAAFVAALKFLGTIALLVFAFVILNTVGGALNLAGSSLSPDLPHYVTRVILIVGYALQVFAAVWFVGIAPEFWRSFIGKDDAIYRARCLGVLVTRILAARRHCSSCVFVCRRRSGYFAFFSAVNPLQAAANFELDYRRRRDVLVFSRYHRVCPHRYR